METVIIVIHLMVVLALVGVVLLQRSEGGGLGIGGGSGFMTARGAANALTRATAILAAAFFITSLGLSLLARYGAQPIDILDRVPAGQTRDKGRAACSTSSAARRSGSAVRRWRRNASGGRYGDASGRHRSACSARRCSGQPACGSVRRAGDGCARCTRGACPAGRAAGSEPVAVQVSVRSRAGFVRPFVFAPPRSVFV